MASELAHGEQLEIDGVTYDLVAMKRGGVFFGGWACEVCAESAASREAGLTITEAIDFAKVGLAKHHSLAHADMALLASRP